ncbi:bifunctional DNA-formamidopyrimidine glycosylase/DNA-(apurinic or apyrimidinic site) lyase [soil metagenome]
MGSPVCANKRELAMPELPEVETVRRGLTAQVVGRRISKVEVGRERTVRRTSARSVIDGLTGTTITAVNRRGKYLLCPLDSGDELMMHLRMSGRVLISPRGAPRPPHTHVVMHLDGNPPHELWFIDPRTFGEVVVFDPRNVAVELPEVAKMGIDPIADGLSRPQFGELLARRSRQIKALLLDQHVVAGIGNIYCDESLHLAGVRWDRRSDSLKPREVTKLHAAIMRVLGEAIEAGGSTLADTQYVGVDGEGGWFQLHHRVYDRAGQRCLTCEKADIVRVAVAGRGTHFCPRCQS